MRLCQHKIDRKYISSASMVYTLKDILYPMTYTLNQKFFPVIIRIAFFSFKHLITIKMMDTEISYNTKLKCLNKLYAITASISFKTQ